MHQEQIEPFILQYGKSLTRLCLKLCRNTAEAEDLYQETWCRIVRKIHLYEETKPFEPWLVTICANTYKNMYKKAKRNPDAIFSSDEEKDWAIHNAVGSQPLYNEEHALLRQIIAGMELKYRLVIVLYYFQDYSVPDLASMLRIPQGTVKSRLFKGRELIKRRLTENEQTAMR